MDTRELGSSGLQVPAVGMGTWSTFDVAGADADANARAVVDRALEAAANFFDSPQTQCWRPRSVVVFNLSLKESGAPSGRSIAEYVR